MTANPIVRFVCAFLTYAALVSALILAVDSGLYGLAAPLAAAAAAALTWCVITVLQAVGYDPN